MMKFCKAGFFAAFAACTVFTGALAGLSGSGILRSEPITAFAEELSLPLSNEAGGWSLSISDLECFCFPQHREYILRICQCGNPEPGTHC